jgi:hypothetical protein
MSNNSALWNNTRAKSREVLLESGPTPPYGSGSVSDYRVNHELSEAEQQGSPHPYHRMWVGLQPTRAAFQYYYGSVNIPPTGRRKNL